MKLNTFYITFPRRNTIIPNLNKSLTIIPTYLQTHSLNIFDRARILKTKIPCKFSRKEERKKRRKENVSNSDYRHIKGKCEHRETRLTRGTPRPKPRPENRGTRQRRRGDANVFGEEGGRGSGGQSAC